MIEDVVSSGGQAVDSCLTLRDAGAEVIAVLCVIDRRDRDAPDKIAAAGLELRSLFTIDALREAVARRGNIANPS